MRQDAIDISFVKEEEHQRGQQSTPAERSAPGSLRSEARCGELSTPVLGAHCLEEINTYRRGEPCSERYGVELLRRATIQGDPEAWAWVHHCFREVVLGWLRRHPYREAACRLESEENFIARAYERFWQATTLTGRVEFSTLSAALKYLRACLHGAILDTLRAYSRPREVTLPEPGEPGELPAEAQAESSEVWEILQAILPDEGERRAAYLLFHCGLKPREIVRFCPQEWSDVREIYRLRRNIMERVLRNADHLRWRLS